MTEAKNIKSVLNKTFSPIHITSALKHYVDAVTKYQQEDWENSLLKAGKFIESILKALYIFSGNTLPPNRQFKVSIIIQKLGQLSNSVHDSIRLTIPRASTFVYDVVSNRGARHDSDDFDPSKMDASVVIPTISWILAELIRFSNKTSPNDDDVMGLTESLMEKRHPQYETIDGRTYVNHKGLSAKDTALLLLYATYPSRVARKELAAAISRHNVYSKNAVAVALTNMKDLVDDDGNASWKLREIGRQKARRILSTLHS